MNNRETSIGTEGLEAFNREIADLLRKDGFLTASPMHPLLWHEILMPEDQRIWEKVKNKAITRDELFDYLEGIRGRTAELYADKIRELDAECMGRFLAKLHARAEKVFQEQETK